MRYELLTVAEAAQALRVGEHTIRRLCHEGGLEHLRVRGTIRIPEEALEALRRPAAEARKTVAVTVP